MCANSTFPNWLKDIMKTFFPYSSKYYFIFLPRGPMKINRTQDKLDINQLYFTNESSWYNVLLIKKTSRLLMNPSFH